MNPLSWICASLNGSVNETPTPTDAEPTPSSDDDNSSTADDGTVDLTDPSPENVIWIEKTMGEPVEDEETADDGTGVLTFSDGTVVPFPDPDPMSADKIVGEYEKFSTSRPTPSTKKKNAMKKIYS
jgi:hypothetical protein